jgi:hypothetical protein
MSSGTKIRPDTTTEPPSHSSKFPEPSKMLTRNFTEPVTKIKSFQCVHAMYIFNVKHLVFTTQGHFTRRSFMAFESPEANALIKFVGYNQRPPYLEKFYGHPFNQGQ